MSPYTQHFDFQCETYWSVNNFNIFSCFSDNTRNSLTEFYIIFVYRGRETLKVTSMIPIPKPWLKIICNVHLNHINMKQQQLNFDISNSAGVTENYVFNKLNKCFFCWEHNLNTVDKMELKIRHVAVQLLYSLSTEIKTAITRGISMHSNQKQNKFGGNEVSIRRTCFYFPFLI